MTKVELDSLLGDTRATRTPQEERARREEFTRRAAQTLKEIAEMEAAKKRHDMSLSWSLRDIILD